MWCRREFPGGSDGYVERICSQYLPAVAASGLADAVDAYCERIAFSVDQVARVFDCARGLGLAVKLHADQLSNMHAAALAGTASRAVGRSPRIHRRRRVQALARAGTVAVLLPGAFYFLRQQQPPPVQALRAGRGTDGGRVRLQSGHLAAVSLLTAMNLAAVEFGLSAEECLAGVTREAARALGVLADRGTIEVGKSCDLAIWNAEQPSALVYALGSRLLHERVWRGDRFSTAATPIPVTPPKRDRTAPSSAHRPGSISD